MQIKSLRFKFDKKQVRNMWIVDLRKLTAFLYETAVA